MKAIMCLIFVLLPIVAFGQTNKVFPLFQEKDTNNMISVFVLDSRGDSLKMKYEFELKNGLNLTSFISYFYLYMGVQIETINDSVPFNKKVLARVHPSDGREISGFILMGDYQINNQTWVGLKQYSVFRSQGNPQIHFIKVWELGECYLSSPETIRFSYNSQGLVTQISCDHNHSIDEFFLFPTWYRGVNGIYTLLYEYDKRGNWIHEYVKLETGKQLVRSRIITYFYPREYEVNPKKRWSSRKSSINFR